MSPTKLFRPKAIASALLLLSCSLAFGQIEGKRIEYVIDVLPKADRTELEITAKWVATQATPQAVQLPFDYYGSPDLAQYVASIEGLQGTVVAPGADMRSRSVTPAADRRIAIKYRMSYDPKAMENASFGPITTPNHFQTFMCQWMLRIGDLDEQRTQEISFGTVPARWEVYSTLAPNARQIKVVSTYNNLISAMIGAGDVASHHFSVQGKPVDVYLDRSFKLKQQAILKKIETVVGLQRKWFQDFAQPFYVISISVRPDNVAGTSVANGFVCFLKEDATEDQLLLLLSHEMLHYWVPSRMYVRDPGEQERWKWEWFDEGFDDYFSRRILLESGSITKAKYAELLNMDLRNIADNPVRNSTYDQVKADMTSGQFSVAHKKLSYYRGAVIASNWDARIQAGSGGKRSLSDVLRKLYTLAAKTSRYLTQDQFYSALKEEKIDAREERERYIIRGQTIEPEASALGPEYRLVDQSFPRFDPGFNVNASLKEKKIIGLVKGSPAEKAGLKEGMPLLGVHNSNRFGNAWDPRRPFTAKVEIDGKTKEINYMPHGAPITVPQYVRAKRD